jgi:hypothetical protein
MAGGVVVSDSNCDISDIGNGFISDSDDDVSDSAVGVIVSDSDIRSGDNEGDVFVLASDGRVSVSAKGVIFSDGVVSDIVGVVIVSGSVYDDSHIVECVVVSDSDIGSSDNRECYCDCFRLWWL